jgi:hypothetical protein
MGPLLLARLLRLNDTQTAVLRLVFSIARDKSLELVDLKDLKKILEYVSANAATFSSTYGNIAAPSVGAVQRGLAAFEQEGAEAFFGEPEQAAQKQGAHVGHARPDRRALFAEDVPELHGKGPEDETFVGQAVFLHASDHAFPAAAGRGDAGKIALDISGENRHAHGAEGFGQGLQGHGLARSRRSRDQAVPVRHLRDKTQFPVSGEGYQSLPFRGQHGVLLQSPKIWRSNRAEQRPVFLRLPWVRLRDETPAQSHNQGRQTDEKILYASMDVHKENISIACAAEGEDIRHSGMT